ncbi:MAG: hypothetical protein JO038_01390 [Alphaproteobacteria bacterium]|nr:hypothetical protein [Alphaproteobacteria bacterium]
MPKNTQPTMPEGMVRLRHDTARSCTHDGRLYEADERGEFLVPAEAAAELGPHGFVPVSAAGRASPSVSRSPSAAETKES